MKLMLKDLCSISQAAVILGVSRQQVFTLIETKRISAVQLDGRFWIIHRPSLEAYLTTKHKTGRPATGSKRRTQFLRKLAIENT